FVFGAVGLDKILAKGELRILMAEEDWWPFFYVDERGELAGIDVEMGMEIARALGVQPVFIRKGVFNDLARHLEEDAADVIISYYSYTPSRSAHLFITQPYLMDSDGILVSHTLIEFMRNQKVDLNQEEITKYLNQRRLLRIGTLADTSYEAWAVETFPRARLSKAKPEEVPNLLTDKEVDVFYCAHYWLRFFLALHPEILLNYQYVQMDRKDLISMAVAQENLSLYFWLDSYIASSSSRNRKLEELIERYDAGEQEEPSPTIVDKALSDPWRSILLAVLVSVAAIVVYVSQRRIRRKPNSKKPPHWLLNMWTVLFSLLLGTYAGLAFPEVTELLSPFGDIFFNYLLLAGIPILFCVVILNFTRLMSNIGGLRFFLKFMGILLIFVSIGAFLGLGIGLVIQPGSGLPLESQQRLAETLQRQSAESSLAIDTSPGAMLWMIPSTMIPNSILKAFVENRTLSILFFGILIAFILLYQEEKRKEKVISVLTVVNDLFFTLFKLSYYVLPFGLFCLMMSQASAFTDNSGLFMAFIKLLVCQGIMLAAWFFIAVGVSLWKVPMPLPRYLSAIKKPMMIIFSLLSTLATLPAIMEVCEREEAFQDENVKGTLPLLLIMVIPTIASIFSLTIVFLVQLLRIEIGWVGYLFIGINSVIAGIAASGIPAPADLYSVSIVTAPLGIPVTQALFFLLPYTLTGARVDSAFCIILNFAIARFFKKETKPNLAVKHAVPGETSTIK
ncbi:MAG: cation:dicarboxylase symporter family transporter, partial [Thermotogota bacterium]|nr:cation:dicarboxylase symporter family transporter [Thermotogota bacterium]